VPSLPEGGGLHGAWTLPVLHRPPAKRAHAGGQRIPVLEADVVTGHDTPVRSCPIPLSKGKRDGEKEEGETEGCPEEEEGSEEGPEKGQEEEGRSLTWDNLGSGSTFLPLR